jgi:hypothetical protein
MTTMQMQTSHHKPVQHLVRPQAQLQNRTQANNQQTQEAQVQKNQSQGQKLQFTGTTPVVPPPNSKRPEDKSSDTLELSGVKKAKPVGPAKSPDEPAKGGAGKPPVKPQGFLSKMFGTPAKNLGWAALWGAAAGMTLVAMPIFPHLAAGLFLISGLHMMLAMGQGLLRWSQSPDKPDDRKKQPSGSVSGSRTTSCTDTTDIVPIIVSSAPDSSHHGGKEQPSSHGSHSHSGHHHNTGSHPHNTGSLHHNTGSHPSDFSSSHHGGGSSFGDGGFEVPGFDVL